MNKEYIQTGETFIISTDKGLKKRKRLNNTTEILETENNIEEMEIIQDKIKNRLFFDYKSILDFFTKNNIFKISGICLTIGVLMLLGIIMSNNPILLALFIPAVILTGISPAIITAILSTVKSEKLNDTIHKKADKIIDKELEKEKQKLEQLNKDAIELAKNDLGILGETIKINRTELIENLKLKLELIKFYELNKEKYTKYYINNNLYEKLTNEGYSKNSILIIEELIKNDFQEKTNQKILKLNKKQNLIKKK